MLVFADDLDCRGGRERGRQIGIRQGAGRLGRAGGGRNLRRRPLHYHRPRLKVRQPRGWDARVNHWHRRASTIHSLRLPDIVTVGIPAAGEPLPRGSGHHLGRLRGRRMAAQEPVTVRVDEMGRWRHDHAHQWDRGPRRLPDRCDHPGRVAANAVEVHLPELTVQVPVVHELRPAVDLAWVELGAVLNPWSGLLLYFRVPHCLSKCRNQGKCAEESVTADKRDTTAVTALTLVTKVNFNLWGSAQSHGES